MRTPYYIGIDVGGTNVRIGLVNDNNEILFEERHESKEMAHILNEVIENFVNKYKDEYFIKAISIGFPGLVDNKTKTVIHTPNQRKYEGDYLKALEEKLGIPIVLGNDVNYLLLYDAISFNIKPDQSVLGFYLGTGFGNAIRIGNKLYEGEHGAAGEIGHVPVYLEGINIDRKQEDLETIVSGLNLIRIHEKNFKETPFDQIFIKHFNDSAIQNYLHILAFYIATEIIILDISTVILGGGVIMSDQFPREYLEELIKRNIYFKGTRDKFKVYYANKTINSGIIGAAIYAKDYTNLK